MLAYTILGWSIFYLLAYALLPKLRQDDVALRNVALMLGLGHLTVLAPLMLTAHWITLTWVLQAALLFTLGMKIEKTRGWGLLALMLAFYRLAYFDYKFYTSLFYYTTYTNTTMLQRLPVLLAAVVVALGIGLAYEKMPNASLLERRIGPVLVAGANFALLVGLMRETSIYYYVQRALEPYLELWARESATHTIIMVVHGLTLIMAGIAGKLSFVRKMGILLLLASVAKILLIDLTGLETVWRIVVFLATGTVLVTASYLYQRFVVPKSAKDIT